MQKTEQEHERRRTTRSGKKKKKKEGWKGRWGGEEGDVGVREYEEPTF